MKLEVLVITWLAVACMFMPAEMIKFGKKTYPIVTGAEVGSMYIADHRYIANYHTANASRQDITRAVIVVHGKRRDAWNYYRAIQSAVKVSNVNASKIFIMAPLFLSTWDMDLAKPTSLIWKDNSWMDGGDAINHTISSFSVLDYLVTHFSDKSRFPNLDSVVITGHSGGAQLVQRYSLVGNDSTDGINLRYVIANPSSFVYFNEYRPRGVSPTLCPGYNTWKYGIMKPPRYVLDSPRVRGLTDLGSTLETFAARDVVYMNGQYDNFTSGGLLDTGCEAEAQGVSHIDRGLAYWSYITSILPLSNFNQDIEIVPFMNHNATGMFCSTAGVNAILEA
ncbi:hypothetical protein INT44_003708 [Umbelopsis vinacea]|uniref:Uncharacterized protein n=1 Tax=Umbelopsis vinacea TaxID=44442 RepID=A0A8H7PV72_9FUNG|nr:hypothetical protein INT44_003708 [Umbelopsis vinacea]